MDPKLENHLIPLHFTLPALNSYNPMEYFAQQFERNKKDPNVFHNGVACPTPMFLKEKHTTDPPKAAVKTTVRRAENKMHKCQICGKILSSTSSYYVHMKRHSGNKPYHCTICEVSFCRKPYLEVHMRTHTGERPFQCSYCHKKFTQKSSLNIHKRSHTGEKPYSCEFCDKKFAVKSYVDAHRWTHSFEKPLLCDKCHIPFNSRTQYVLHMKTHSLAFAWECYCGRAFTKDSYLIRHQNKVHGGLINRNSIVQSPDSVYSHGSSLNAEDSDNADFEFSRSPSASRRSKLDSDESNTMPLTTVASAIQEGMQSYSHGINSNMNRL